MEDDNEITDEDIWGLGESSLILMENEIEELLKKNNSNTQFGIIWYT